MKKMSKKVTALALAGLMLTPLANFTGITAEAATTYKRTVKIDVPQLGIYTPFSGYTAYLVNASTGKKTLITDQNSVWDFNKKLSITITGSDTYYSQVCMKTFSKTCVNTGIVTINEKTFKPLFSSLKITVKPNGSSFKATLNVG